MTKLKDAFRNFVNARKNVTNSFHYKSDRANFNFVQMKPYRTLFYVKDIYSFISPGETHETKLMTGHLFFLALKFPFPSTRLKPAAMQ